MKFIAVLWLVAASLGTISLSTLDHPAGISRRTVTVSRDGRALEIQRDSDRSPVLVPVLDRCGDPPVGDARIQHTKLTEESVLVIYGKHCEAKVDLKTLGIQCIGCD